MTIICVGRVFFFIIIIKAIGVSTNNSHGQCFSQVQLFSPQKLAFRCCDEIFNSLPDSLNRNHNCNGTKIKKNYYCVGCGKS